MLGVIRNGKGCNAGRMVKVESIDMHEATPALSHLSAEAIDSIVDFLRGAPDLKHLPKSVDAWISRTDWPGTCPREAGVLTRRQIYFRSGENTALLTSRPGKTSMCYSSSTLTTTVSPDHFAVLKLVSKLW